MPNDRWEDTTNLVYFGYGMQGSLFVYAMADLAKGALDVSQQVGMEEYLNFVW